MMVVSSATNAETFDEVITESLSANDTYIYGNMELNNKSGGLKINLPRAAENYSDFIVCRNNNIAVYSTMFSVSSSGSIAGTGLCIKESSADNTYSAALGINFNKDDKLFSFSTKSYPGTLPEKYYPMRFSAEEFTFDKGDMVVNGKITCKNELNVVALNAKDINVEMSNAADYVFDENYDLKSLSEVESYVKENKHLPGIPSAADMAENGMNVSTMSNLLLEKVEELTLHLIRLEKENAELKAKFESLEK